MRSRQVMGYMLPCFFLIKLLMIWFANNFSKSFYYYFLFLDICVLLTDEIFNTNLSIAAALDKGTETLQVSFCFSSSNSSCSSVPTQKV